MRLPGIRIATRREKRTSRIVIVIITPQAVMILVSRLFKPVKTDDPA